MFTIQLLFKGSVIEAISQNILKFFLVVLSRKLLSRVQWLLFHIFALSIKINKYSVHQNKIMNHLIPFIRIRDYVPRKIKRKIPLYLNNWKEKLKSGFKWIMRTFFFPTSLFLLNRQTYVEGILYILFLYNWVLMLKD